MRAPTSKSYFDRFLMRLGGSTKARHLWQGTEPWANPPWTSELTAVLVETTSDVLDGTSNIICAKGQPPDRYGRYEYLTIDVTAYDDTGWKAPTIIVEHENFPFEYKIQYCAWKLLCIEAQLRVLVAYVDSRDSANRYNRCFSSQEALIESLMKVHADHSPDKSLAVIVGEWGVQMGSNGWNDVFRLHVLP
jgi:hypothetical protein